MARTKDVFKTFEEAGPPPYERTWQFEHQGIKYTLYYGDYLKLVKNKLDLNVIYGRLTNGWELFDALDAPREIAKYDYGEWLYQRESLRQAERVKKKLEEEKLAKKTWLNKYPQSVKAGKWYLHLSKYDIFPKRKVSN